MAEPKQRKLLALSGREGMRNEDEPEKKGDKHRRSFTNQSVKAADLPQDMKEMLYSPKNQEKTSIIQDGEFEEILAEKMSKM